MLLIPISDIIEKINKDIDAELSLLDYREIFKNKV